MDQVLRGSVKLEGSRSPEHLLESHSGFQPCERRTQAQMDAPPEPHVAARSSSPEVDLFWVVECGAVAVGCRPDKYQPRVSRELHTGELGIYGDPAVVAPEGRIDPAGFFDEPLDQVRVRPEIFLETLVGGQDRCTGSNEARR